MPQGEFKKFLVSNSSEKQSILRTLFNSSRFEEMQNLLLEQVKSEKKQIESRYDQIQMLWDSVESFDDDELMQLKLINSLQTKEIVNAMPQFKKVGYQLNDEYEKMKSKYYASLNMLNQKIDENNSLINSLSELDNYKKNMHQLDEKKEDIEKLKKELQKINEVKSLNNLYQQKNSKEERKQQLQLKLESTKNELNTVTNKLNIVNNKYSKLLEQSEDIENKNEYLKKTNQFFNNINKYSNAYQEIVLNDEQIQETKQKLEKKEIAIKNLETSIDDINIDSDSIDQLTQQIYQLKSEYDKKVILKKNRDKYIELQTRKEDKLHTQENLKNEILSLTNQLENVDKTNIDLNDKKTFVKEIQQALHIGDVCPICGNQIESLNEHIDFEKINKNQQLLKEINNTINTKNKELVEIETTTKHISEQMNELDFDKDENINLNEIERHLNSANEEKLKLQQQKEKLEKIKLELENAKETKQELRISYERLKSLKQQNEILINDFEKSTQYTHVEKFRACFDNFNKETKDYQNHLEQLNKEIQLHKQSITLKTNNKENQINQINDLNKEIEEYINSINEEMTRLGLKSFDEVEELFSKLSSKDEIETEINNFEKEFHKLTFEIERLTRITSDKQPEDVSELKNEKEKIEQKYNSYVEASATIQFKIQKNEEKFDTILQHIDYLDKELKEQQEIFELSEILSGKNSQKLTVENYVLIHYLERIIEQANIRLERMSGERYQLKRRQSISQGYSGLEIDVFDFHTNKSRHISSLSGGETFQASLALALGLSEVVQQESGGITLESMFIDEGFGTLDQETLETALDTLVKLKTTGRMVGIISHVSELKQRIPLILEVSTNQYQSQTKFKWN